MDLRHISLPQAAVCGGLVLNDYFHLLTAFLTLESAHLAL